MAQGSSCYSMGCGYVSNEVLERCPKCGGKMRSATQIQRLGWLLLVLGLLLVVGIGAITFYLAPIMLRPTVPSAGGSHFKGTVQMGMTVLGLFGTIILFGLLSMANGAWQIAKGLRNPALLIALLVSVALVVVCTAWVMYILPH